MTASEEFQARGHVNTMIGRPRLFAVPGEAGTDTNDGADSADWGVFQEQVALVLDEYSDAQRERAARYSPTFRALWEHLAGTTSGGKRMRPKLVYLTYKAFGGTDWKACSTLAAAFEMLHAALLVHDDVIDRDFVRRGSATLGAIYRDVAREQGHDPAEADHAGHSAAIIAGDLLLTGSLRLGAEVAEGHVHSRSILETLHEAIFASAAGELDDLLFSLHNTAPDLTEVLNMERLKTAVYSFEAPLRAGALLAGQSRETADALASVGRDMGVAYQVVDDILGTFGQSKITGKSVDSDLREGKRTILTTLAGSSTEFSATLEAFHHGDIEADEVRSALSELGIETHAVELAEELVGAALNKAAALELPQMLFLELAQICDYVLTRRK